MAAASSSAASGQKCGATRTLMPQFASIRGAHLSVRARVVDGISKLFQDDRPLADGLPPAFLPLVDGVNADLQSLQSQSACQLRVKLQSLNHCAARASLTMWRACCLWHAQ